MKKETDLQIYLNSPALHVNIYIIRASYFIQCLFIEF